MARGRRRGRLGHRHCLLAVAAFGAGAAAWVATSAPGPSVLPVTAATLAAPVDGTVMWIAVSPAYRQTGLVLASINTPGCVRDCLHLWVSRDGGATWRMSHAAGWRGGRFTIATAAGGSDVVFAESPSGLQRSDDGGDSWRTAGAAGSPAVSPRFAGDATVAVASTNTDTGDYVLRGAASTPVSGSAGTWVDLGFALSPSFPAGGRYAPALLSAADAQAHAPVIEQCDAQLTCKDATTLPGAGVWAIPVDLHLSSEYPSDGTVFARAGRSIYKSTTGGRAFTPLVVLPDHGGSVTAYPMLALAPHYSEAGVERILYVSALQATVDPAQPGHSQTTGGIYRSTDGGATWSRLGSPSPLDTGASALAVAPDGRLFAGYLGGPQGSAGLLCSSDGSAWATTCPPVGSADRAVRSQAPALGSTRAGATACAAGCAAAGAGDEAASRDTPAGAAGAATAQRPTGLAIHGAGQGGWSSILPLLLLALGIGCTTAGAVLRRPRFFPVRRAARECVPARRPVHGELRAAARKRRNTTDHTEVYRREKPASG